MAPSPIPPPMHSVTRPYWPPVRARWCNILAVRTAPVAPIGCPKAIAPPTGFIFSSGTSSVRSTAMAMEAKASLASTASRSSTERPAFLRASLEAGIIPVPITEGSTPATAAETNPPATGVPGSSELLFVRLGGPLVAPDGVGVGVLAGYAELLGHVLGRDAHVIVVEHVPEPIKDHVVLDLGRGHPHPVAVAALGHEERRPVHVLDAAGHDHVGVAQGYLLGRGDYGLQSRATHPVQRHAGDLDGQAALYAHLSARVHALARGQDVADYHLVYL